MSANLQPAKQGGMAAPQEHAAPSDTNTRTGDGGGKMYNSAPPKEGTPKPVGGRRNNGMLH